MHLILIRSGSFLRRTLVEKWRVLAQEVVVDDDEILLFVINLPCIYKPSISHAMMRIT